MMELYVRMCRKAQKDLQRREPELNDVVAYRYVFDGHEREGVRYFFHLAEDWQIREESKRTYIFIVWRQDQLQEMIKATTYFLLMDFSNFVDSKWGYEACCINKYSMEQLWLAFVMKEKFKKIWEDDKWKKAN